MKTFIIFLLFATLRDCAVGQRVNSGIISLESTDTYILNFRLLEEVSSINYINCYARKRIKKTLYKIQIDKIIHISDTSVYKNTELIDIKYALFDIKPNVNQMIGCFWNSEIKQCLLYSRDIDIDPNIDTRYYQHAVIVRLSSCRNGKKILKAIEKYEYKIEK
jgi:hypothetical protein